VLHFSIGVDNRPALNAPGCVGRRQLPITRAIRWLFQVFLAVHCSNLLASQRAIPGTYA